MNVRLPAPLAVQDAVLDNGLTILVHEDRSAPVVSAQLWVATGSIHEGDLLGSGLSHYLEHMFFKGSSNHPASALVREVQDRGGRMNAYTSFDRTVFYVDTPANGWHNAVEILADAVRNPLFPAEEFDREQGVILRELDRGLDDPDRRLARQLWATAYVRHPYRHPVIGYRPLVESVTRDAMLDYFRRRYTPHNMTFVLAGDLDVDDAVRAVREAFEGMPRAAATTVPIPPEPTQSSPRHGAGTMSVELTRVGVAFPSIAFSDPDVAALDLVATILGDGRGSRLYRRLRDRDQVVHDIDAWSYTPLYPGLFGITAVTDPDRAEAARMAILDEIDRIRAHPPSREELDRAVHRRVADAVRGRQTMSGRAREIGEGFHFAHDPAFTQAYLEAVAAATPDDLLRVARRYLRPEAANFAQIGPAPADAGPEAGPPTATPATTAPGAALHSLANGIRVVALPDHRLPLVEIRAVLPGGVLRESRHNSGITALTGRALVKGTETRSGDEITDAIESVGGTIGASAGNNTLSVSVSMPSESLDVALDILTDVLLHPSFPEDVLDRERDAQIASVRARDDRILRVAQRVLRETVFGQHPYRLSPEGEVESLAALTREDVVVYYRSLLRPESLVVSVAGDIDPDDAVERLRDRLAAIAASTPPIELPDPPTPIPTSIQRERPLDRHQAVVLVGFAGIDVTDPRRPALDIVDTALSGQGTALFERVREQKGLAYYVGSFQLTGFHPGMFAFYAGTEPETAEAVRDEILAEAARLRTDGLSDEEIERARNRLVGGLAMRRQALGDRALSAALDELYGLGYDHTERLEALYRNVTADDVRQVASDIFRENAYAVAIVRPAPESPTENATDADVQR